jgi:hypothetical protein
LYTKATQTILDPYGAVYTWEFKETIMGLRREEVGERIIAQYDLPITLQDYLDQIEEQIELLMPNCVMMPGNFFDYKTLLICVFLSFYLSLFARAPTQTQRKSMKKSLKTLPSLTINSILGTFE